MTSSGNQLVLGQEERRIGSSEITLVECDPQSPPPERVSSVEVGDVLGGIYELRRVLGRGGMGQVYEAHDRLLNRSVAIKVSWSHIGFEPLWQEARALAALGGRGVPNVYTAGTHGEIGYCAMERLYGQTLGDLMFQRFADGRFAVPEVIEILCGIAAAMVEVHGVGLIHRDLKPANIMMTPGDRIVLLDFGLFLTQGGHGGDIICGSPHYIAPEVIDDVIEPSQAHLVDIYALGVIGFMLLAGHTPFNDLSLTCLLAKHVHQPPPSIADYRPDAPVGLCRLINHMLAKDPAKRPFSAEALIEALRAVTPRD